MSMIQYGNSPANKHRIAAGVPVSGFTEYAGYLDFIFPGTVGISSQELFLSHENNSHGLRLFLQNSQLRGLWRFYGSPGYNTTVVIADLTPGTRYRVWVRASILDNTLRFAVNGAEVGSVINVVGGTFSGNVLLPSIAGSTVDGTDIEYFAAAIFAGNVGAPVPTFAAMLAHEQGASLDALPGVAIGTNFTGANNTYADTLVDFVGDNDFIHMQGDTTNANGNQPKFAGVADLVAGAVVASSQAAWLTYQHTSTGTAYFIAGLTSANSSTPTPAQIKAGQNQNGTSAPATASVVLASPNERDQMLVGTTGGQSYRAYMVIETAPDVFTPVISWTFTTPRIGVRSIPIYAPTNPPALWASQTAIDVSVVSGARGFIGTDETGANGIMEVDLSTAEDFYPLVGATAKLGFEKSGVSGYLSRTILDLGA